MGLAGTVHCMAKEKYPPKKGPHRMATASKPEVREEIADRKLAREVDAFVDKVHSTIEEARSKMSEEERREADAKAEAIFRRGATCGAKSSPRSA